MYIGEAAWQGFHVTDTGHEGLFIGRAGKSGVYVGNAAETGLVAWAEGTGAYADTLRTNHEWGFYTPDKIYSTGLASGGPLLLVAQNGATTALEAGDVVAASGLGTPFAGGASPMARVERMNPARAVGVAGVVYGRLVTREVVDEIEGPKGPEQRVRIEAHSAGGPVAPGEHLLMVVLGPCQVKVDATSGAIHPGDPLMISGAAGRAALARPLTVQGVTFLPPGLTVGTALEPLDGARGKGTIMAYVTLP
jgi:hypothetical protein